MADLMRDDERQDYEGVNPNWEVVTELYNTGRTHCRQLKEIAQNRDKALRSLQWGYWGKEVRPQHDRTIWNLGRLFVQMKDLAVRRDRFEFEAASLTACDVLGLLDDEEKKYLDDLQQRLPEKNWREIVDRAKELIEKE